MHLLTVSQLNTYLRELLDVDEILRDIWVEGEIFDFKRATSGHWYFALKEGEALLNAVCWRSSASRIPLRPGNGDSVLAHGRIGFYEANGRLQLYVDSMQPVGVGILHARFEELKTRLDAEGLFDESRKRPLPVLPHRIGVATSPTGAAIRDILNVLARRYPLADVEIAPCQVQGEGSAQTVVDALHTLYKRDLDVIIVARGGGSTEDLWTFNEEIVARAAFASPVPLVSGVGHEVDTTIIDYVADVRAPTPSAAAELVTPERDELHTRIQDLHTRLLTSTYATLQYTQDMLSDQKQRLTMYTPHTRIQRDRQTLDSLVRRTNDHITHQIALRHAHIAGLRAQMMALSPQATLDRGYAVVQHGATGQVVTSAEQLDESAIIDITVSEGTFQAKRLK
ncbi:MAG: exodeoxyribonuclease VII large subunit [Chloroflexi bacterium AL-N10]|nr:exodeoxyribonuclease VII large subunit [Chloroflexi bacterium AL-N1]NOK70609.1 exodeoxyribonuclease VII large subunit [Chloroflexi bacterium AL-N10]NOK77601.1 exodeoxyribonuclease VII large subunit [Chloroflexi bacterium AL-N5]NOK92341.1 exodeoxyribonuclease VII large subunit [Chloroflexi bacterium AL-N15]